ncbi:MAG: (2Fe-2S)-binding protein [Bdellovibrionia bacterium]
MEVGLQGRDLIRVEYDIYDGVLSNVSVRGIGCHQLLGKVELLRGRLNGRLEDLLVPEGHDHASLLAREIILKIKGLWNFPYGEAELCHCRAVPTAKVDEAIVGGDHRVEDVAESTSAGSACGSCRKDTQRIIDFRLNRNQDKDRKAA